MFDAIREELQNGQAGDEPHGDNPDDLLGHDNQAQRIGILKEYKFRKLQVKTKNNNYLMQKTLLKPLARTNALQSN